MKPSTLIAVDSCIHMEIMLCLILFTFDEKKLLKLLARSADEVWDGNTLLLLFNKLPTREKVSLGEAFSSLSVKYFFLADKRTSLTSSLAAVKSWKAFGDFVFLHLRSHLLRSKRASAIDLYHFGQGLLGSLVTRCGA